MSVVACPECEGQVTLPPGARAVSRVKCPLCEAEFPLSDLYAKLPPMLILLDAPVETPVHAGVGTMSHGTSAFDSLFVPTGAANGEGDLHLADGEEGEGAFAFGESSGGTAVATAPSTKTATLRPKKAPKSAVKEIIKIVLGGVVGLSIGYMILLWGFNRDLLADVPPRKPIGKLLPEWMHWAIPAGHRPGAPKTSAPATEESTDGETDAAAAGATDETTDEGTDNPTDAPGEGTSTEVQGDATGEGTTPPAKGATPADAPADSDSTDNNSTDSESSTDTTPPPGDTTPGENTPKSPATDDPGFEVKPTPEFEIEEPKIDPIPPDMPPIDDPKVDDPKVDEPKVDEPKVDEPKATDPQVKDPAVTDPPADNPPIEDPFDVKPGETPKDDPATTEPKPTEPEPMEPKPVEPKPVEPKPVEPKPVEPKPVEPKVGLKVETPVDEKTVESARAAASGMLDTLMPADAAAKAGFTRQKYDSFVKLCEYANSLSHGTPDVTAANAEAAKAMVLMVSADDADNRVLGQLANTWLSRTRGNDGIALAGKVTAVASEGGLTTITVELPALGEKLAARTTTIVTRETAEVAAGDEVAAVGSVVDKPADKIEGYKGADSQVIWGAWVGKRSGG